MRQLLISFLFLTAACKSPSRGGVVHPTGMEKVNQKGPTWELELVPARHNRELRPALLGHYDLSGALFKYDQVKGLAGAMKRAGVAEWRVGVGRWEAATLLLPTLTNGKACPFPLARAKAPAGQGVLDLIRGRDWFVDTGQTVTLAHTGQDARYALGYVRSVLDTAAALGAVPFVSIDLMPRALAANRAPEREHCLWSFTNKVSNARPADHRVFAAAVEGLVRRIVEGSGAEAGRAVTHFEIWNEPDLPYFWDRSLDPELHQFFAAAATALVRLDAYRKRAGRASLRFGLGGFASHRAAIKVIQAFDGNALPNGKHLPLDFISFHGYSNDPLEIAAKVRQVAAAVKASTHFRDVELVLSEWGPDLKATGGDQAYAASMEPPLLMSTVIALGANMGLSRSHHTFFWDFYAGDVITWGLYDHAMRPKPLAHAYQLMARLIGAGARRLDIAGIQAGKLDGGQGAILAAREAATGKVRVLLINRGKAPRRARLRLDADKPLVPNVITLFDNPARAPRKIRPEGAIIQVPARSLLLVEY